MIELEIAIVAALLLLTDMVCSGIAAWRSNPQLSAIAGSATTGGTSLVIGAMIMPLAAAAICAIAVAVCLTGIKTMALRQSHP